MAGTLTAGSLLSGRYRIVQLMGEGGFGAVYRATDERFQGARDVAIKEMSDAKLNSSERELALEDFRREANLLVQLSHPNLPHVSDFFEEDGKAYLVMEFIEGKTLEQEQEDSQGPLDDTLVMGWALQLCDVLSYLHNRPQPIIFRDIKPSNVMVTIDNQLKLIDFGIARVFKASATRDTALLGSQGYAPLEQYGRGQSDPRSDIYALGATLYQMLTGSVPADAPSRRINPEVFVRPRQLNPRISEAHEEIILTAMEQDPAERFQSIDAMRNAILAEGAQSPGKRSSGAPVTSPYITQNIPPEPTSQSSEPVPDSIKTTFERTILPLAIDIGTTIYQAVKERSSSGTTGNGSRTEQAPHYAGYAQQQGQKMEMAPLTSQVQEPVARKASSSDNVFVGFIRVIYHLLGLISTIIVLLLIAHFIFTFFGLSMGEFSSWVNDLSTPLIAPFGNILVPFHPSSAANYMVDVSAIVAFVVYSIGFGLIRGLLKLLTKR
jgi:serine/threonine protein kinase